MNDLSMTLFVLVLVALHVPPHSSQPGGRLRPPAAVTCDRSELTSYSGRVASYRPLRGETVVVIDTDADTRETVRVVHQGRRDGREHYLVNGQAWTAELWRAIEPSPGTLAPGQRVTAWVCADGRVVVDWTTTRREP